MLKTKDKANNTSHGVVGGLRWVVILLESAELLCELVLTAALAYYIRLSRTKKDLVESSDMMLDMTQTLAILKAFSVVVGVFSLFGAIQSKVHPIGCMVFWSFSYYTAIELHRAWTKQEIESDPFYHDGFEIAQPKHEMEKVIYLLISNCVRLGFIYQVKTRCSNGDTTAMPSSKKAS